MRRAMMGSLLAGAVALGGLGIATAGPAAAARPAASKIIGTWTITDTACVPGCSYTVTLHHKKGVKGLFVGPKGSGIGAEVSGRTLIIAHGNQPDPSNDWACEGRLNKARTEVKHGRWATDNAFRGTCTAIHS